MGLFGVAHTYPRIMKLSTVIPYLKIQKICRFELVKQSRFAKIYKRNREKGPPKIFFWICERFYKKCEGF